MTDVANTVRQIENDFKNQRPPFDDVTFPEERLLDELDLRTAEDKLQAISLFSTLDYNRDANQLVDKILELRDSRLLDPEYVADHPDEVIDAFRDVSFRYKNRDANAWYKNCTIIAEQYNGNWQELLLAAKLDAPKLVERLEEDGFSCLKGDKIAPMYARIINDEVYKLLNLWELDIPVDTHIRRLSQDLFSGLSVDLSDDDVIREQWRGLAIETDIDRAVVDGALWHIGNKWDGWGEDYWNKVAK